MCVVLQVIEEDLGLPWTEIFSSLSPCPVAAASLGQVYRGRLVSNGAEVAVKVGVGGWGSRVRATDVVDLACDAML
jgi:predicted unusual protein kinase regulating ubiquinone biosynthesis (AarF/ABC1/UbiB family)